MHVSSPFSIYIVREKGRRGGRTIKYKKQSSDLRKREIYVRKWSQKKAGKQSILLSKRQNKLWLRLSGFIGILGILILILPTAIVQLTQSKEGASLPEEDRLLQQSFESGEALIEVAVERSETKEIEAIPLEQYVASVVASEMPAHFELAALKAQAIAARTYIVNHLLQDEDLRISDTTEHQVYRNKEELQSLWGADFHWKWEKISQAVKETENLILTYENEPITPTFFSMSNGYTEDAKEYWGNELPYLKSVESKWEENLPNFITQEIFTIDQLNDLLGLQLAKTAKIPIQLSRTPSHRVKEVAFGDQTLTGRTVRERLNLRSTDFSIQQKGQHLIFTTKGYGHGVGMSQYGANGMAEEGKSYEEILSYYYQDIEISEITETAPSIVTTSK